MLFYARPMHPYGLLRAFRASNESEFLRQTMATVLRVIFLMLAMCLLSYPCINAAGKQLLFSPHICCEGRENCLILMHWQNFLF